MTLQARTKAAVLAVAALVSACLVLGTLSPPAQAAMNVHIVNTAGMGVSSRSAPQLAARNGYGAPERAVVTILCHAWGDPVGARSNRLWDLVAYAGRQFYVPDLYTDSPTVANVPLAGMPFCGAAAPAPAPSGDGTADAAASWASAHVGQVYASSADHALLARFGGDAGWAPGPYGEWSGDCLRFASAAWYAVGVTPQRGGTAKAVADAYSRAGRLRGGVPPRGALVFYVWGSYGHVGVSLGNGQVVSTRGVDGNRAAVRQHAYNGIGLALRGWVDPR